MYNNEYHIHECHSTEGHPMHPFPMCDGKPRGKRVANFNFLPVQADWTEKDEREISFILNKPPFALSVNGVGASKEDNFNISLTAADLKIHGLQNDEIFEVVNQIFTITEVD